MGEIVEVSFRNKKIQGAVIGCVDLKNAKASVKKGAFALKSVSRVFNRPESQKPFLNKNYLRLAKSISDYYYAPLGLVLKRMLPNMESLFSTLRTVKSNSNNILPYEKPSGKYAPPYFWFGALWENIENSVKESLNQGKQTLLLVPTGNLTAYFFRILREKFSDSNTVIYSFGMRKSLLRQSFNQINSGSAKIIIGARSAVFAPFNDLGFVAVVDPENSAYKSWDRKPYYNANTVVNMLASIWSAKTADLNLPRPYPNKINVRAYAKITGDVIPDKIIEAIEESFARREKILIIVNRRGAGRFTLCRDCGFVFVCKHCSASLPIHIKETGSREFVCHHCGSREPIPILCPDCQSYNLKDYGIGLEKADEELKKHFPGKKFTAFEKAKVSGKPPNFEDSDAVVATEAALNVFDYSKETNQWDLIIITFFHQFLALPDFSVEASAFSFLSRASMLAKKILVGVIEKFEPVVKKMVFNPEEFVQENESNLQKLNLPPFKSLIKLTITDKNENAAIRKSSLIVKNLRRASQLLKVENSVAVSEAFPAFMPFKKNLWQWEVIMRVDKELDLSIRNRILDSIPNNCKIDVEPKSLI